MKRLPSELKDKTVLKKSKTTNAMDVEEKKEPTPEEIALSEENKLIWKYKDSFADFPPKDLKIMLEENGLSDKGGILIDALAVDFFDLQCFLANTDEKFL